MASSETLTFFFFLFAHASFPKLKYSRFTMLCYFLVNSKVIQFYI